MVRVLPEEPLFVRFTKDFATPASHCVSFWGIFRDVARLPAIALRIFIVFAFAVLWFPSSFLSGEPYPFRSPVPQGKQTLSLDSMLARLAGDGAVFCGHVGIFDISKSAGAAGTCGEKALKKHTPFYIAYDNGFLADGSWGFAIDRSGIVHELAFDKQGKLRDQRSSNEEPRSSHSPLDIKLRELAGELAISCGHVALGVGSKEADRCARRASDRRSAFLVAYDNWGECCGSWGLARNDDGAVYFVSFHSARLGKRPTRSDEEGRSSDSRLSVTPCPEWPNRPKNNPYRLLDARRGGAHLISYAFMLDLEPIGLTCFPLPR